MFTRDRTEPFRIGFYSYTRDPFGTGPDRFQTVPCSPFLEGPEKFSHPESQNKISNFMITELAFRVRKLFVSPYHLLMRKNTQLCIQSFSVLYGHLTTPFTLQFEMHLQLFLSPLQRPLLCCFDRRGFLAVGPSWCFQNNFLSSILLKFHSNLGVIT